jgi:hypothetical protein
MHLLGNHRSNLRFNQKLSFVDEISIPFLAEMSYDIFDANRVTLRDIRNIRMQDVMTIDDNNQATPDCFQFIPFSYQYARVFSKTNAYARRVCSNGLG